MGEHWKDLKDAEQFSYPTLSCLAHPVPACQLPLWSLKTPPRAPGGVVPLPLRTCGRGPFCTARAHAALCRCRTQWALRRALSAPQQLEDGSVCSTLQVVGWWLLQILKCFQVSSHSLNSPAPFFQCILHSSQAIVCMRGRMARWLSLLFTSFLTTELCCACRWGFVA